MKTLKNLCEILICSLMFGSWFSVFVIWTVYLGVRHGWRAGVVVILTYFGLVMLTLALSWFLRNVEDE